jgi:hypothetical protein
MLNTDPIKRPNIFDVMDRVSMVSGVSHNVTRKKLPYDTMVAKETVVKEKPVASSITPPQSPTPTRITPPSTPNRGKRYHKLLLIYRTHFPHSYTIYTQTSGFPPNFTGDFLQ